MFNFLYIAVSWVLLRWHSLFSAIGLNSAGGLNWTLSIIFLVVTARLLLFRLFIKQVKYQRHMQEMQPKIQELRKKYKSDKAEMQRQMMKLQQEQGFNPLSGCLPMFLQIPIFIGLFHVLRHLSNSVTKCGVSGPKADPSHYLTLYTFNANETCSAAQARLFGGAPLAGRLTDSTKQIQLLGGNLDTTRIVILILVIFSAAATFLTQLLVRRSATTIPEGTAATVQKVMLVGIPLSTLGSGLFFPLGVLLYWFTSNTWTMLQQVYVNRFHPPEAKDTTDVGLIGKTLAPRPGQRPTRPAKGKTSLVKQAVVETEEEPETPPPVARAAPRPGQRPTRPSGNRPPAKRPSQAKKRR